MDKFPLLWKKSSLGELTTEREALYTWFTARCRLPGEGLWCAWAVGTQGELRIGVLEPAGDQAVIRRRFSDRMTAPLGKLLRGELRPALGEAAAWEPVSEPARLFHTSWLQKQLRETANVRIQKREGIRYVAIPYDPKQPFPMTRLFCFARVCRIEERMYAVFAFDQDELPVFP